MRTWDSMLLAVDRLERELDELREYLDECEPESVYYYETFYKIEILEGKLYEAQGELI